MRLAAVAAALTVLAVPRAAHAQTVAHLDGSPLDVFVDGIGGLQVRFDGQQTDGYFGEFCCDAEDTSNGFAVRGADSVSTRGAFRTNRQPPSLISPRPGTQTIASGYDVQTFNSDQHPDLSLHVDETVSYTDGSRDVALRYVITNTGKAATTFVVGELADLYVGGDDRGRGVFTPGPPRFVGGSDQTDAADGLVEAPGSTWTRYEEAEYDSVFDDFGGSGLTGGVLADQVVDNEVGVEWDVALGPGASRTIDVIWRFGLGVTPPPTPAINSATATGSTVTLSGTAELGSTVTIFDGSTPVATTRAPDGAWAVAMPNVPPGTHSYTAVATDAAGRQSSVSQPKTVTVASTPAATPTPTPSPSPTPTPLPPPVVGKAVNAQTKSGTIKIKLPGTNKFIELGPGQQIPNRTIVDATKGRITLTTAVGGGKTQHADFYQGVFKVTQSRGRKPLTTLTLAGPKPTCSTRKHRAHRATAARTSRKKRVKTRKLWGSGHGAFRTKGQYSSATVRGTTWLTQDSCAGTLTRVTRGAVQVRDFVRHKKKLVRAGHRYLARAKRR